MWSALGLGGDFDGLDQIVEGLSDRSKCPAHFAELARRGYSQADLEKLSSRHMMRVLRAAEAYTASVRSDPPIENATQF